MLNAAFHLCVDSQSTCFLVHLPIIGFHFSLGVTVFFPNVSVVLFLCRGLITVCVLFSSSCMINDDKEYVEYKK